jgi:hypothetical protein
MWTQEEARAYECACEVISDMIAIRTAEITVEERQDKPDQGKLAKLEAQITELYAERDALDPDDTKSIARIRSLYGEEVRAYYQHQPHAT